MRADRLVSILMLLQTRGRMTAPTLADELEVSVRTIYRDIDALSIAGVPVYTDRGRGGGISLLGNYRTTLTGLTQDELRALFMLRIPGPLADLGLDRYVSAALRKLAAALPATRRGEDERARQRVHFDPTGWSKAHPSVPHLEEIYRAVWHDRLVRVRYQLPFQTQADWIIAPYGLVSKAQEWYLIGPRLVTARRVPEPLAQIRVLPLSRVLTASLSDETFPRPEAFDLPAFWQSWCQAHEANRPRYPVSLRVGPSLQPFLAQVFGDQAGTVCHDAEDSTEPRWITLEVEYDSLDDARRRVLSLGGAVEVLEPPALRNSVQDFAQQILKRYDARDTLSPSPARHA